MHNLALLYQDQGRVEEAVTLMEGNLEAWQRAVGDNHTFTLQATHALASAYRRSARAAEAVELLRDLVVRRSEVLGEAHPGTLASKGSLAEGLMELAGILRPLPDGARPLRGGRGGPLGKLPTPVGLVLPYGRPGRPSRWSS